MPWLLIWTLLVIGSLALGFFLFRNLWRKARALMDELARASEVLAELTERTSELTEVLQKAEEARAAAKPEFTDVVAVRREIETVRKARLKKKQRRHRNHDAKRRTWRDIAIDPRFDRWRKK
ncbi:MAG TPA: hypothetical protein VK030_00155 [Actinomycetales bacterium]|nr:hypothetical protein [Actinomycetales bacterium]